MEHGEAPWDFHGVRPHLDPMEATDRNGTKGYPHWQGKHNPSAARSEGSTLITQPVNKGRPTSSTEAHASVAAAFGTLIPGVAAASLAVYPSSSRIAPATLGASTPSVA